MSKFLGGNGDFVSTFLRLNEIKTFPEYSLFLLEDRNGNRVSFYNAVKASPMNLDDVLVKDCIKVEGIVADLRTFKGVHTTRLNRVKVLENMGSMKKSEEKT